VRGRASPLRGAGAMVGWPRLTPHGPRSSTPTLTPTRTSTGILLSVACCRAEIVRRGPAGPIIDAIVMTLVAGLSIARAFREGMAFLLGNAPRSNSARDRKTRRLRAGLLVLVPDCIFVEETSGSEDRLRFVPLEPPDDGEVEGVLRRGVAGVDKLLSAVRLSGRPGEPSADEPTDDWIHYYTHHFKPTNRVGKWLKQCQPPAPLRRAPRRGPLRRQHAAVGFRVRDLRPRHAARGEDRSIVRR